MFALLPGLFAALGGQSGSGLEIVKRERTAILARFTPEFLALLTTCDDAKTAAARWKQTSDFGPLPERAPALYNQLWTRIGYWRGLTQYVRRHDASLYAWWGPPPLPVPSASLRRRASAVIRAQAERE